MSWFQTYAQLEQTILIKQWLNSNVICILRATRESVYLLVRHHNLLLNMQLTLTDTFPPSTGVHSELATILISINLNTVLNNSTVSSYACGWVVKIAACQAIISRGPEFDQLYKGRHSQLMSIIMHRSGSQYNEFWLLGNNMNDVAYSEYTILDQFTMFK
jgi:hypothetical protein